MGITQHRLRLRASCMQDSGSPITTKLPHARLRPPVAARGRGRFPRNLPARFPASRNPIEETERGWTAPQTLCDSRSGITLVVDIFAVTRVVLLSIGNLEP